MGYQSGLLGAMGSVGSGISIATMLYRQTPEYKISKEIKMQKNESQFLKDTAGKAYAYDKGVVDKNNVVTLNKNERREAALEFQQSNYDLAKKHYMIDPNPKYIEDALKANAHANEAAKRIQAAQQSLEQAKEQKRQKNAWRDMPTNMGMTAGEITDRLGPKAEEIVKKEMAK